MKTPMTDKEFTFTMGKLLKQKKFGLYKLALKKRKDFFNKIKTNDKNLLLPEL
jgi:hypothetical protein